MTKDGDEKLRRRQFGRDELNLAEFPLSLIGKRAPGNVKTLHFSDSVYDRSVGREITRKLTISAADLLGLPTAMDDEVLLGCMQLTQEQKFKSPKVQFERSHLLDIMNWKRSGKDYRRLTESLHRWKGTLIISENAFWNRGEQCWVNDSFNLLNRVSISGRGKKEEGRDTESYFEWGDFMWNSIESGNLRKLDFELLKSLNSAISKRLYRLLSKRFYHGATVRFDLRQLAHEKVGLSRNMHTGQIKEKLNRGNDELQERGICQSKYVEKRRGHWEIVYTSLAATMKPQVESPNRQLEKELDSRGIKNSCSLVKKVSEQRIITAIENYDDRRVHGELIGPGWLRDCLTAATPYGFRRGYISQNEIKAKEKLRLERDKSEQQAKLAVSRLKHAMREAKRCSFAKFYDSLSSDEERKSFAKRAIESNRFFYDFIRDSKRQGEQEKAERYELEAMMLLWEQEQARAK